MQRPLVHADADSYVRFSIGYLAFILLFFVLEIINEFFEDQSGVNADPVKTRRRSGRSLSPLELMQAEQKAIAHFIYHL